MSVPYYGDFAEDDTVDIPFNTFSSDDPSASCTITNFINTDVHIHKDGGLTQRNNASGITVSVDFDGITGNHLVAIDTSDDTVAGFWVTGSEYQVRIEGTTVDGATINAWIGSFSIERAGGALALLKNATYGLSAIESLVDDIGAAGAGLTAIPWNSDWDAEVQSECTDALNAYDPPTKAEMDTAHSTTDGKIDALNNIAASDVWDATVNETTAGANPTTAKGKLQGIWNRLFTKKTVTASLETAYEKDDSTAMETWDLADDDTTASRTR